jgi:ABC-type bacteriocin/lantibiotic exporter with double-glycine peptidase domain
MSEAVIILFVILALSVPLAWIWLIAVPILIWWIILDVRRWMR